MKPEENPCFNCADRKAMCRIGCKRAKEWTEKQRAEKEKQTALNQSERDMRAYQNEKCNKYRNYKTGKYYGK